MGGENVGGNSFWVEKAKEVNGQEIKWEYNGVIWQEIRQKLFWGLEVESNHSVGRNGRITQRTTKGSLTCSTEKNVVEIGWASWQKRYRAWKLELREGNHRWQV